MTIQEQLRDLAESAAVAAPSVVRRHVSAAADRIDALEAALREIAAVELDLTRCGEIAREALEAAGSGSRTTPPNQDKT